MARRRTSFTEDFKQKVINAYYAKKGEYGAVNSIAKEFGIDRIYVHRWAKAGSPSAALAVNPTAFKPKEITNSAVAKTAEDPRDRLIYQLKQLVADYTLKIAELEARLNGNKRYSDRRLYSNHPSDSA